MKIIAVVGSSGSGKTRLIEGLVSEFRKRGSRPAVVKHCPHGFDRADEGKDSRRFLRAGAVAATLVGPGWTETLWRGGHSRDLAGAAAGYFLEADLVLVEGGGRAPGLKKIEVRRPGLPAKRVGPAGDVVALVSETAVASDRPVFRPGQVARIARFIERSAAEVGPRVRLRVDGREVPLAPSRQEVMEEIILGLTATLSGSRTRPRSVVLALKRRDRAT
jgi:molybdopterin-guanine dinucleotide biosynthesis protein MobB